MAGIKYKDINDYTKSIEYEKEIKWIEKRRSSALNKNDESDLKENIVGLALSGGGIRSATFNLGLLQAIKRNGILKFIDYMSTVSGGGYIGSCLTWFMCTLKKFPFGTDRNGHTGLTADVLHWLRSRGKYLIPGDGLTIWTLISAVFTGTFINLVILVPIFLWIFKVLSLKLGDIKSLCPDLSVFAYNLSFNNSIFNWIVLFAICTFILFIFVIIFIALTSRFNFTRKIFFKQNQLRKFSGSLLKYTVLFLAIGLIPQAFTLIKNNFREWFNIIISAVPVSGIITLIGATRGLKKGKEARGIRSFLLSAGLSLVVYGIFLWFYHITSPENNNCIPWEYINTAAVISIIFALLTEVNHISLHRYYRNRLMEAYMPEKIVNDQSGENKFNADRFLLKDIDPDTGVPYHIINTNLQTVGSNDYKLSSRGGDNFIFSPCYCGSRSTAYHETEKYLRGNMNLATSFAISGAAVDTNMYMTRSRPVSFLMSFFNIRLGYWIKNPNRKQWLITLFRPQYIINMFRDMFGRGLNEKRGSIHLSDGGHFENLGLYELIRRKCKFIIFSDAGADGNFSFEDLGKIIELARVDFGAQIDIKIDDIIPDKNTGYSSKPYARGKIKYSDKPDFESEIIYIKTSLIENLSEDIYSYKRKNPTFPDQSTADQFFDEDQFEAYRELGYQVGHYIFGNKKFHSMDNLFEKI